MRCQKRSPNLAPGLFQRRTVNSRNAQALSMTARRRCADARASQAEAEAIRLLNWSAITATRLSRLNSRPAPVPPQAMRKRWKKPTGPSTIVEICWENSTSFAVVADDCHARKGASTHAKVNVEWRRLCPRPFPSRVWCPHHGTLICGKWTNRDAKTVSQASHAAAKRRGFFASGLGIYCKGS